MSMLLKLGRCPFILHPQVAEPHCHANSQGECEHPYCPQLILLQMKRNTLFTVQQKISRDGNCEAGKWLCESVECLSMLELEQKKRLADEA
jgi:hypothetical protein